MNVPLCPRPNFTESLSIPKSPDQYTRPKSLDQFTPLSLFILCKFFEQFLRQSLSNISGVFIAEAKHRPFLSRGKVNNTNKSASFIRSANINPKRVVTWLR